MVEEMACNQLVEIVTTTWTARWRRRSWPCVRDHLASCDGCKAHIEQMRATVRVLRSGPEEEASPELANALADMFREWASSR